MDSTNKKHFIIGTRGSLLALTQAGQVKKQLEQGSAVLVYSELHESINILPSDQFKVGMEEEK